MPVSVRLTRWIVGSVRVLMMFVVHMPVFVFHLLVQMSVFVPLHQMKIRFPGGIYGRL